MKKTMAILLALVLVLGGSVTAGAATDTPVKLKVDNTQISVTVPTIIVGTVNWTTGDISFATTGEIINTGVFKIHVESIICNAETGWTLGETGGTTADTIVATIKTDVASATTVPLLATAQDTTGVFWDMDPAGGTDDELALTLAGKIENAGAKTAALTTTEAQAFSITFTVASGAN